MRAFLVKQGTPVKVIRDGKEWLSVNFVDYTTTKENMFFIEDMRADPTGISPMACGPQNKKVVGGAWAKAGYYGFTRDGYTMMVQFDNVEVH